MEPSSTTISEPGGIRPPVMSASSRVVFAATCTPAVRSSLVAFWEVAVPNTCPVPSGCAQARAAAARTRVLPVPAGPVITSTVRAEVSTCQTAAAWSSRSPRGVVCSRASCARSCSCAAQQRRVGAQAARRQLTGQPRRTLRLRLGEELFLQGQLRGGGVPRDAGPGVDAAPVQLAAQRAGQRRPLRGLQRDHLAGSPGQGLLRQAEQQLPGGRRVHVPGLRRHHQGELLEQVVPGPGRMFG